jgi:hypothetical protein
MPMLVKMIRKIIIRNIIESADGMTENIEWKSFSSVLNRLMLVGIAVLDYLEVADELNSNRESMEAAMKEYRPNSVANEH